MSDVLPLPIVLDPIDGISTRAFLDSMRNKLESIHTVSVTETANQSTTTTIALDDSIPQSSEGVELFTVNIKPTNVNNRLLIDVLLPVVANDGANNTVIMALFQDSTANALAVSACEVISGTSIHQLCLRFILTAATTSTTTFKLRYGGNAGTTTLNNALFGVSSVAIMTVTELPEN